MSVIKIRNKNEYFLTEQGLWVRNFAKQFDPVDINNLTRPEDYALLMDNELKNRGIGLANVSSESLYCRDAVIISDGNNFEARQDLLAKLPKRVKILGVNHSLPKWKTKRPMDYYIVNNPYRECLSFLPRQDYFPTCIASARTNNEFLKRYKYRRALVYRYEPVREQKFSTGKSGFIDDYRNPICAAISLLNRQRVEKLLLVCCDEVFAGERPGAEKLDNGYYTYPQHKISHGIIEGLTYWMRKLDIPVTVGYCSDGMPVTGAVKVEDEQIVNFFE